MYVEQLHLQNFRCYEDFTIGFSPRLTVIVAENGKGKTAILDALAIAMTPYLSVFHGSRPRNFQPHDVRMILEQGRGADGLGIPRMKYQLPVSLEVSVRTGAGEGLVWQRELKTLAEARYPIYAEADRKNDPAETLCRHLRDDPHLAQRHAHRRRQDPRVRLAHDVELLPRFQGDEDEARGEGGGVDDRVHRSGDGRRDVCAQQAGH